MAETLERLARMGLAKLLLFGESPFDTERMLRFAKTAPFFVSVVASPVLSRLPPGPNWSWSGRARRWARPR